MPSQQSVSFGVKFAVFLVGVFAFLQVYAIQAILPALKHHFNATAAQLGISVAMTVTAIAMMSPVMGIISDRYGRKLFITLAMVFLCLPTFMISFSPSIGVFNGWRFLQGLCIPAMTVVVLAYISEEYPKATSVLSAVYVAGTVLGGFLGRFILGHLHEFFGYQNGFRTMAVMTLLGAICVQYLLPTPRHFIKNQSFAHALTAFHWHRKNRAVISTCALGGCILFSLVGCFTFINLHLAHQYALNSRELGNIFAVYLIGVVITPLSVNLIDAIGTKRTMITAIIISIIGLIITLSTPLWLIIVGLTIMSVGVFITQSASIGYLAKQLKVGRSLGLGLYYMSYYAGGSLGAWACGVAYGLGGWGFVVGGILIVQLLAIGIGVLAIQ